MKRPILLAGIAAALPLTLAACAAEAPEEVATTEPYNSPTNAVPIDRKALARTPENQANWAWVWREDRQAALYGPPQSEAVLSIRCDTNPVDTKVLVFNWTGAAERNSTENVTARWGGGTQTFPVSATETALGTSGYDWSGELEPTGEIANFLLTAPEPVTFSLRSPQGPEITVPASDTMKRPIHACQ